MRSGKQECEHGGHKAGGCQVRLLF
jgi:hypothetical protein